MDVTELRIGNLFQTIGTETRKVTIEQLVRIKRMPNLYNPIPLTEEWLLKFGFLKEGEHGVCIAYGEWEIITENKTYFMVHESSKGFVLPLFEVHQLQNLYHALTGEELKTQ
jgi:hypothetical protein